MNGDMKQDPEPALIGEALLKAAPNWLDEVETITHAFRYACAHIANLKRERDKARESLRILREKVHGKKGLKDILRESPSVPGQKMREAAVILRCLYCGTDHQFPPDSNEANGIFNVFCPNGECEDRYAARQ